MTSYRKILVIADARHVASAALRRGAQLALQCGADLTIALFDHDAAVERAARRGSGPREAFLVERRQWLQSQVAPWLDPSLRLRIEAVWAPQPREAILATVLAEEPDLVVKDFEPESAPKHLLSAPLDNQLAHTVPVPLMLVRPASTQLPRRVLAAVHMTHAPLSERVLQTARRMAACCEARVDLAQAYPHDPREGVLEGLYAQAAAEDQEVFSQFASDHAIALERRHWVTGEPHRAIHRLAGMLRADLLTLGSVYHPALEEHLSISNTADSLMQHGGLDVLLAKPAGFIKELGRHFDLESLRRQRLTAA